MPERPSFPFPRVARGTMSAPGPAVVPGPASMSEVAHRLAQGINFARLPEPASIHLGTTAAAVVCKIHYDLFRWAQWLGAGEPDQDDFASGRPGHLIRRSWVRVVWRGYVIELVHSYEYPAVAA